MTTHPITKLLQQAVAAKGLTIIEAAALCGLPESTMYALVAGDRGQRPQMPTLHKLAQGLGINLDDLLAASGRDLKNQPAGVQQARREQTLLTAWRDLNERDQRLALALIKGMRSS